MEKENSAAGKNASALGFIIKYMVVTGFSLILVRFLAGQERLDIMGVWSRVVTCLTTWILYPFGILKQVHGSTVVLDGASLRVDFGCNGLEAVVIYAAAVICYPARLKTKALGIAVGFLVLQFANVLRIAAIALGGAYFKEYFHIEEYFHVAHYYVGQGLMIVLALVTLSVWLHYASKK